MKINIKSLFKDKILIYAFLFSAVWHIFWLSAINVVVVPKTKKNVKFSNVSFLGPILDKGALNAHVVSGKTAALDYVVFERDFGRNAPEVTLGSAPLESAFDLPPNLVISGTDGIKSEPDRNIGL